MINPQNLETGENKKKDNIERKQKKIVFFVRQGGETFLDDIINRLSKDYETKLIVIKGNQDLMLIDKWMDWADISWFEWCDSLIVYGSKLPIAEERIILCRLHSYEAFTNYPSQVNWNNVDSLIFIAEHLRKFILDKYKIDKDRTTVIPNGVDLSKWTFKQRSPGFKVAYVGYINYKKGPMLLLHTFKALYDRDNRFEFHIAGQFQDPRDQLYFQQMIKEFGLENNLFFEGWQENLDNWLENKNHILCTSVLESQNMSVMQSMTKGIKPVIHNFAGAKEVYPKKYLWNTIDEAVGMITDKTYNSMEYKKFIEEHYSLEKQLKATNHLISKLIINGKKVKEFNYQDYWNKRLTSNFTIEGVGYIGLGEIYNKFLYQNRISMLDGVLDKAFDKVRDISVLELGPGTGLFTDYFHSKGVEKYHGIDIVEKSITELSNRYHHYHFKQGDISDSNKYEGKYHLILAADVLLHITKEENYQKTIHNISRHLHDQGICILLDPVSVINTKSTSPHVIIRDIEYIKTVLEHNQLELIEMLPIAFFMNFPFDKDLIGDKGAYALEAFNLISKLFSNKAVPDDEKQFIGTYLANREKQLLYEKNFGLSQKLLIIQRKGEKHHTNLKLDQILNIELIKNQYKVVNEHLNQTNLKNNLFNRIKEVLKNLDEDSTL